MWFFTLSHVCPVVQLKEMTGSISKQGKEKDIDKKMKTKKRVYGVRAI